MGRVGRSRVRLAVVGLVLAAGVIGVGPTGVVGAAGADPVPTLAEFPLPTANATPEGIAAGPDGNVWFTDPEFGTGNAPVVGRITPAGVITEFTLPDGVRADKITAGADGNLWFSAADKIGRMTPAGAVQLFDVPAGCCLNGDMTAGPDGNVWFTHDSGIGRITPSGQITVFSVPFDNVYVRGITAGPDGNVWYTRGKHVGRVSPSGTITEFDVPDIAGSPGGNGITTGPDGNLWFLEGGTENGTYYDAMTIDRIAPNGVVVGPVAMPPITDSAVFFLGIGTGPDGAVWAIGNFSSEDDGFAARATPAGDVSILPLPGPPSPGTGSRSSPVTGPDGNVWFADGFHESINRIALPGATITSLTSSSNPTVQGSPLTLTARVTAPVIGGTPDGSVQFEDGGVALGPPVTLVNGQASMTTSALPLYRNTLRARYSGGVSYYSGVSFELAEDVQAATKMQAEPAIISLTQPHVYAFTLSAVLARVDGQPNGAYNVDMFDATGQLLCRATNIPGPFSQTHDASCSVLLDTSALQRVISGGGYRAVFAGDYYLGPNASTAPLITPVATSGANSPMSSLTLVP